MSYYYVIKLPIIIKTYYIRIRFIKIINIFKFLIFMLVV